MLRILAVSAMLCVVGFGALAQQQQQQDTQAATLMLLGSCNVKEAIAASRAQQLQAQNEALAAYWAEYVKGLDAPAGVGSSSK
jgi:ABC-type phosphate transport system substrate-binding protein